MGVVNDIYDLKFNAFIYGEYIASFYSSVTLKENNILLAPLIIPLCSYPNLIRNFETSQFGTKKQSTLRTKLGNKLDYIDLQDRIYEFSDLTSKSIQYCLVNDWISINTNSLSIECTNTQNFVLNKAARNLGLLFSNLSVLEIYSFLGVEIHENNNK